ncbi:hypothetical protein AGMMS50249_1270 [candidate division SR1 bacterium]|nr:hypothetical protein AGMMS50249_1270 [candidate division SR1 bacterium]
MFIEKGPSGAFLVKKVAQKKISTKLLSSDITAQALDSLAQKETTFSSDMFSYKNFASQLHNPEILQMVLIQTKQLLNRVEAIPLLEPHNPLCDYGKKIQSRLQNQFPAEFIFHSNHIEGSKISQEEITKILEGKKSIYPIKNEIQEVKNSLKSRNLLKDDFIRNISNIKKLYHTLTKNLLQETGDPYPRGFKKYQIIVNNQPTSDPTQVETFLGKLITEIKLGKKTTFPLQLAFDFHLKYEQIHPFTNGNGRTGRLLMDKILIQNGFLPMIVFKDNKDAYFNAIQKASENVVGLKKYYTFMIEQYGKSVEKMLDFVSL